MATIGLKDLFYAKVLETPGEPDMYDTPKRLAKAITAKLSVETAEAPLHADDAVDVIEKEFVSGELTLGVNDLAPEDVADILGQTKGEDGVVYANTQDAAPYVAIGFRARKPGGRYKYIWIYKVKFGIPDEDYKTKGDSIEYATPEIVGTFLARPDGNWKADYVGLPTDEVAKEWFNEVKEPEAA